MVKFSELTEKQWVEWRSYLDTCILPVTGLNGEESPVEAAGQLERLRGWLDGIEIPFRGRIVTYPACHFATDGNSADERSRLNRLCIKLRSQGFVHIVIVSAQLSVTGDELPEADLVITPDSLQVDDAAHARPVIKDRIQKMWNAPPSSGNKRQYPNMSSKKKGPL